MPSLPFVVPPAPREIRRVGNEQTGVLEIEMRGGLTVYESALISDILIHEQSAFVRGAQIADTIAKEEEISLVEAFNLIEAAVGGGEQDPASEEIRLRHSDRINELIGIYAQAGQRNMQATVTALIKSRCCLPDWELADTQAMDTQLFEELWDLAREEQAAEKMQKAKPTEDDLKKQPPVEKTATKRTGRRSSGS